MASQDFLATIKLALSGKEAVVAGLQETQSAADKLTMTKGAPSYFDRVSVSTGKEITSTMKSLGDETGKSFQKMGDFEKSIRRVIVVAPIWMAFRAILQTVTSAVQEGAKTWAEFDRALTESHRTLESFSGGAAQAASIVSETMTALSRDTGIALGKLGNAFFEYGRTGASFEDSLNGSVVAAKLAKVTFGDTAETTKAFAIIVKQFSDSMDSSLSPMQKQEVLAAKIGNLYHTNSFNISEYMNSVEKFSSTAKIMNMNVDQTLALFASLEQAGMKSSLGVGTVRMSLQKLLENLDKVAPRLGLGMKEGEQPFQFLIRVLERINQLSKTEGAAGLATTLKDVFGGARTTQGIIALNSVLADLRRNLSQTYQPSTVLVKEFNDDVKRTTEDISGQLEKLNNFKILIGQSFIQGITGGKDFKESLKGINEFLSDTIPLLHAFGTGIRTIGSAAAVSPLAQIFKVISEANNLYDMADSVKKVREGLLSVAETEEVINKLEEMANKHSGDLAKNMKTTADQLKEQLDIRQKNEAAQERISKTIIDFNNKNIQQKIQERNALEQLTAKAQEKLAKSEDESKILALQAEGMSKVTIETQKLDDLLTNVSKIYRTDLLAKPFDMASVKAQGLRGDLNGVVESLLKIHASEQDINNVVQQFVNINKAAYAEIQKQREGVHGLVLQYEKASPLERGRIRRQIELTAMTPEQQIRAYEENKYDRNLLLGNVGTLPEETQRGIVSRIAKERNLPEYGRLTAPENILSRAGFYGQPAGAFGRQMNITGVSNMNVNVNVQGLDEESIRNKISKAIDDKLLHDEDFQKAFSTKISGKL